VRVTRDLIGRWLGSADLVTCRHHGCDAVPTGLPGPAVGAKYGYSVTAAVALSGVLGDAWAVGCARKVRVEGQIGWIAKTTGSVVAHGWTRWPSPTRWLKLVDDADDARRVGTWSRTVGRELCRSGAAARAAAD
jgi:hypothetical protein